MAIYMAGSCLLGPNGDGRREGKGDELLRSHPLPRLTHSSSPAYYVFTFKYEIYNFFMIRFVCSLFNTRRVL